MVFPLLSLLVCAQKWGDGNELTRHTILPAALAAPPAAAVFDLPLTWCHAHSAATDQQTGWHSARLLQRFWATFERRCSTRFGLELSQSVRRHRVTQAVCLLVCCLTSHQLASVSQGRICSGKNYFTFYFTQSLYTDSGPISPSTDPITPLAWQGNH